MRAAQLFIAGLAAAPNLFVATMLTVPPHSGDRHGGEPDRGLGGSRPPRVFLRLSVTAVP